MARQSASQVQERQNVVGLEARELSTVEAAPATSQTSQVAGLIIHLRTMMRTWTSAPPSSPMSSMVTLRLRTTSGSPQGKLKSGRIMPLRRFLSWRPSQALQGSQLNCAILASEVMSNRTGE
jgi:hypothetical protein